MYHVEQVVKCGVTSSVPATRRINLSLLVTPTRTSEDGDVKLGSIVSGTVEKVTEKFVSVNVGVNDYIKGIIYSEHLADNHGIVSTMMELLKPGYKFVKLLVLDGENNNLILTAKYSLVNAAQHLPADASQVYPNSIVPAVDDHRAGLSDVFYVGQSVRSNIQDVTSALQQMHLSFKTCL